MTVEEFKLRAQLFAFKILVRTLAGAGAYGLLARFCLRYAFEIKDGQRRKASRSVNPAIRATVLVLDYDRFRGDIDLFSQAADIRIVGVSWSLLLYLLSAYVHNPTEKEIRARVSELGIRWDFAGAQPGSKIYKSRERYRAFLRKFLPKLFQLMNADVIMNSDFRYRREADIVRVAAELGYAHICYYREAMYMVPAYYHHAVARHEIFGPFNGFMIAVQNAVTKKMFLEARMAPPGKIVVRGCPRMDALADRVRNPSTRRDGGKQIAYFSAPYGSERKDLSLKPFDMIRTARKVVRALAEIARDNPNIRVVLKIKDMHAKGPTGGQVAIFEKEIAAVAEPSRRLDNIEFVTDRFAAHDVLAESDVVCAMQSTVVLEAAALGKPVILPHLRELQEQDGAEEVLMYRECRHLFDVPNDVEELKRTVMERLRKPDVDPDIMRERSKTFEEYVSSLNGGATEKSLDLIRMAARTTHANLGRMIDAASGNYAGGRVSV